MNIDCFIVGNNVIDFQKYTEELKVMGKNSVSFRDFNGQFIDYQGKSYDFSSLINRFSKKKKAI